MQTLTFPSRITLELTDRCNYLCSMCPSRFSANRAGGFMDPGMFRGLVDQAKEHSPALVPFFRGESLLHPQVVELIAYAKKQGLGPVQLATNASLLSETIACGLLEAGLDFISFSLDTLDAEHYRTIRKGGSLAEAMANAEAFIGLRRADGFKTQIQVSATRTRLNADDLKAFVEYWRPKVNRVRIYPEHSKNGHYGSLDMDDADRIHPRRPCSKPFQEMVVLKDGLVASCNHDWKRAEPLGDLKKQTLSQVWDSAAYQGLRRQHLEPQGMTDPTCLYCDHWQAAYAPQCFIGELYEGRLDGE